MPAFRPTRPELEEVSLRGPPPAASTTLRGLRAGSASRRESTARGVRHRCDFRPSRSAVCPPEALVTGGAPPSRLWAHVLESAPRLPAPPPRTCCLHLSGGNAVAWLTWRTQSGAESPAGGMAAVGLPRGAVGLLLLRGWGEDLGGRWGRTGCIRDAGQGVCHPSAGVIGEHAPPPPHRAPSRAEG